MEHELQQTRAVAHVDEDQPAVVAAAVHPARDADGAALVRRAQVAGPGVAQAVGARRLLHSVPPRRARRTLATTAVGPSTCSRSPPWVSWSSMPPSRRMATKAA